MILEVEGVVMRRTKYGESSLIVDLLSPDYEMLTLITSGISSKKGQHRSALLQLGHQVVCNIYYKEGGKMHRIKDLSPETIYQSIPLVFEKGAILLYMIELMRNSIGNSGSDITHYQFMTSEINALDELEKGLAYFPLGYTIRLSNILGFAPNTRKFEPSAYFDMMNGVFTTNIPPHPHYLSTADTALFYKLCLLPAQKDIPGLNISKNKRSQLIKQLLHYFKLHIDHFRTPNSQQILNAVFNA